MSVKIGQEVEGLLRYLPDNEMGGMRANYSHSSHFVIREIPLTHSIPDVCRRMSTELTKTVYDNPHGERILYLLSAVLFNIQGNSASLRAKPVHISGHLPSEVVVPCNALKKRS